MKVLSLFDGISCGRVALERAGIPVEKYYASEIDKYAIQIAQKNHPDTIQLGDITKIDFSKFAGEIDLVIGGSPCQGFSFAGKRLNFEDSRSKLFFEFVRAVREIKPKYFLLENVKMKQEYQDIISEQLGGVQPIEINSALVSAQNRKRLYWTNIPGTCRPTDKGIMLKDIILTEVDEKYFLTDKNLAYVQRQFVSKAQNGVGGENVPYFRAKFSALNPPKARTMAARQYANWRGTYISQRPHGKNSGGLFQEKSPTLTTSNWSHNNLLKNDERLRRLTPVECERLQTLPDGYTDSVSDSQRYKVLGNGWTVDVIAHIFKGLK